jgi:ABC-type dipeptide/oligopeptide/nickel transport system permease component
VKLWQYILRRLLLLVPVLVGITLITFGLAWFATHGHLETQYISLSDRLSEEKIDRITKLHGFDKPGYVQYFVYMKHLFSGDMGISTSTNNQPVDQVLKQLFPASAELAVAALLIAILFGIPLGILSATHRDKAADHVSRFVALSGVSVPVFWLALILQIYLGYHLAWFPIEGRFSAELLGCSHPVVWVDKEQFVTACGAAYPGTFRSGFLILDSLVWRDWVIFTDAVKHLVLPAFTLGFVTLAIIMRMMRASMLEVLGLDFVRTARAKGLEEKVVVNRHARRNALIPTMTVIGLAVGGLMGGAVLTETIFSWPGLGRWATKSILSVDVGALMGFVLLTAIIYVIANLIVDLLYAYLDPRVRLE